jgi:protein-tyrosine phosphatase
MRGLVDLHCHWVPSVDDGARTVDEGRDMLAGLYALGFDAVVATPHMRPGLFDNDSAGLLRAFESMQQTLPTGRPDLPVTHLGCEHFFDDVVFQRLMGGHGLPYPGGGVALVEFAPIAFPLHAHNRFYDLRRVGIAPVLAHPERYAPVWKDKACLEPLLDAGALLLLDVCALIGKYGQASQRAAEALLDEQAYEAACTDSHRARDLPEVERAIVRLTALVGPEETLRLLAEAPRKLLIMSKSGGPR